MPFGVFPLQFLVDCRNFVPTEAPVQPYASNVNLDLNREDDIPYVLICVSTPSTHYPSPVHEMAFLPCTYGSVPEVTLPISTCVRQSESSRGYRVYWVES